MLRQLFGCGRNIKCLLQMQVDPLLNFTLPSVCVLQTRNTFILKRKWPPGLHKKGERPKKLKARNHVYELIVDTNTKKKEDIDVILTDYVSGLGDRGTRVSVKPLYGYHKLLLPGLAVYPTPDNVAKYCNEEEAAQKIPLHSSPTSKRAVDILSREILAVTMNKEMPWKLEPWHIRASFRKAGFHVPEEAIEIPKQPIEGPNLDIQAKEFTVTVTINNLEKVQVRCRIHHWSTLLSDKLPYVEDHWKLPAEPLFPQNS